jgi:nitrogen regulatory protein PII
LWKATVMKMIWAILKPESILPVIDALRRVGIYRLTRMHGTGYGGKPDLPGGSTRHTEKSREILMVVLADCFVAKAVIAIRQTAKAHTKTDIPDSADNRIAKQGKIFVTYVEDCYTIRSARKNTGNNYEEHYCDYQE